MEMNKRLNAELEWLSGETGYKTAELEEMNVGDYNQKLIYHSAKNRKPVETLDDINASLKQK